MKIKKIGPREGGYASPTLLDPPLERVIKAKEIHEQSKSEYSVGIFNNLSKSFSGWGPEVVPSILVARSVNPKRIHKPIWAFWRKEFEVEDILVHSSLFWSSVSEIQLPPLLSVALMPKITVRYSKRTSGTMRRRGIGGKTKSSVSHQALADAETRDWTRDL